MARNPLASPDTLAVEAGAFLALTAVAAFTLDVPILAGAGVAFAGGLAAAALVLGLSGGAAASTLRLVLAGSVIALGLGSLTSALMILFTQETRGLHAWGAGSLGQRDLDGIITMAPVVAIGVAAVLLLRTRPRRARARRRHRPLPGPGRRPDPCPAGPAGRAAVGRRGDRRRADRVHRPVRPRARPPCRRVGSPAWPGPAGGSRPAPWSPS